MKNYFKINLFIIGLGIFLSGAIIAFGQTGEANISFPVTELGNCGTKQACRDFCEKKENIKTCLAFAKEHNLLTAEELAEAEKFLSVIGEGGPGGCRDKASCKSYCADTAHLDECLSFAESKKMMTMEELKQAKMVANALKQGAGLPGNCKDKASCENYCADAAHIDECLGFAEKSGFLSAEEMAEARKALPFIKSGETPGKCATKKQCDAYCEKEENFNECLGFAEKAGFISADDLAMAKKTGGKGPGGCRSRAACETFCNKPENQETCFKFASEHGLIPDDKLAEIKEGVGRLRIGLSQAPGETVACLKEKFGNDIVGQIESGKFMPGPGAGEMIKACFDIALPQLKQKIEDALSRATPEVLKCLDESLGAEWLTKIKNGEPPPPEIGDKMRVCFKTMKDAGLLKLREGLNKAPIEMRECVKSALGAETYNKITGGEDADVTEETESVMKKCLEQLQSALRAKIDKIPGEARECIKGIYGSDFFEKIMAGEKQMPADIQAQIEKCLKTKAAGNAPAIPAGASACIDEIWGAGTTDRLLSGDFKEPADFKQRIEQCIKAKMMPGGQ